MLDLLLLLLSLCRPARILSWALCLAGVCFLWLAMEKATLRDYIKARARYNSYYEQVQRLQRQRQQYKNELADIKAGGFRLEKTIREECPLIRPGEKILYIETPEDANANATSTRPRSFAPGAALGAAPEVAADAAETPAPKKKARSASAAAEGLAATGSETKTTPASATRSGRTTKKNGAGEAAPAKRASKRGEKTAAAKAETQASRPAADPAPRAPKTVEF